MNDNEKPLWMYFVILMLFMLPAVFVAGVVTGSNAEIPREQAGVYISSAVSAIATMIIAILTIILAIETWRLRRNQDTQIYDNRKEAIKPYVEISLESSFVGFQFMILRVENVGRGMAKDISFKLVSDKNELTRSEIKIVNELDRLSFFKNNLSVLGVNKSKKSFLFSFIDMTGEFGSEVFDTKLLFNINFSDVEGNNYTNNAIIDLSEYKGITELGSGNPAYRTSKELEKIRKILSSVVDSNKKINVDSYSENDRDEERKRNESKYAEVLRRKTR